MMTFESDIGEMIPARFRPGQLKRMLGILEKAPGGRSTDLVKPLSQLAEIVRQRSLVIIISDFLVPVDPLRAPLAFLRARHHEVMLMRTLDPSEVSLQLKEPTMLRDLENDREIYIDPQVAASRYRQRFEEHAAGLTRLTGPLGISITNMMTNEPLEHALFDLLSRQQEGHLKASRQGRSSAQPSGGLG